MSKTAQRKAAMYDQGYEHGRTGHYFYWRSHPFMDAYRRGYTAGSRDRHLARRARRPVKVTQAVVMMVAGALVVFGLVMTIWGAK